MLTATSMSNACTYRPRHGDTGEKGSKDNRECRGSGWMSNSKRNLFTGASPKRAMKSRQQSVVALDPPQQISGAQRARLKCAHSMELCLHPGSHFCQGTLSFGAKKGMTSCACHQPGQRRADAWGPNAQRSPPRVNSAFTVHSPKALAESGLARFPERLTSPHCALSSGSSFLTSCSSLNILFPNSKVSQEGKERKREKEYRSMAPQLGESLSWSFHATCPIGQETASRFQCQCSVSMPTLSL